MKFKQFLENTKAETGKPITINFIRSAEKSPKIQGDPFQQSIEPHGTYLSHNDGNLSSEEANRMNREVGVIEFKNPLVIPFNEKGGGYDENSWKSVLVSKYKKKGRMLTKTLMKLGFDGIITFDKYGFSEIVSFQDFK